MRQILLNFYSWFFAVIYILNVCTKIIVSSWFNRLTRERLDRYLKKWGQDTFNLIKTKLIINKNTAFKFEEGKKYILISNHASLLDVPAICARVEPSVRLLSKRELSKIPIFGKAMKAAEMPLVDRKNRTQAIQDMANAKKLLETGIKIWIAPEGQRSMDGKLLPFKKGAFIMAIETGATIIPIAIKGTGAILPAMQFDIAHNGTIELSYGEPVDASQYNIKDKDALIQKCHASMSELLSK